MYRTLSWRNIPTARTLFAMVFIAGIGLIISIVALLYLSLHLISTKTNEIDEHRSALSVQGAIQTSVNRVSSLVLDNAVWDDAVHETYRPTLDPNWLYNTWGAGFKINNLYDGTFVLDEHFNVIWGSFQSQPFKEANLWALPHGAGGNSGDQWERRSLRDRAGNSLQQCVLGLSSEALVLLSSGRMLLLTILSDSFLNFHTSSPVHRLVYIEGN